MGVQARNLEPLGGAAPKHKLLEPTTGTFTITPEHAGCLFTNRLSNGVDFNLPDPALMPGESFMFLHVAGSGQSIFSANTNGDITVAGDVSANTVRLTSAGAGVTTIGGGLNFHSIGTKWVVTLLPTDDGTNKTELVVVT